MHFFNYLSDVEEADAGANQLEICKTIQNSISKVRYDMKNENKKTHTKMDRLQKDLDEVLKHLKDKE
jgi:hypothetical protein